MPKNGVTPEIISWSYMRSKSLVIHCLSLNLQLIEILQDFKAQIQESVVYSILAERNVGPKLYAVFPGGRLEEFLPVFHR